jgi:hypothetical protein
MTITVLSKISRNGSIESGNVSIPSGKKGGVLISSLMDTADLEDTTKSIDFKVMLLKGIDWEFFAGFTWHGHISISPKPQIQPGIVFNIEEIVGKTIKIVMNVPNIFTVGAKVEY